MAARRFVVSDPLDMRALAEFWGEGLDDSDDVGTDFLKLSTAVARVA